MYRGLRSNTVDVQSLYHQLNISSYASKENSFHQDDQLKLVHKQSSQQSNSDQSKKQNTKSNKSKKENLNQSSVDNSNKQVRLSIRNLLKFHESNRDSESKKQEELQLNDYIKNVITVHNDKYKYYANDVNNSHSYINYSAKKKLPQPVYQGILAHKGSETEYLPYQPSISQSYWAGISKNSTGKINTGISPYVFKQTSQKSDQEVRNQQSTSRLSSSRSTSRRNSLAKTECIRNGQTIDFDLNQGQEIQSALFVVKDQSNEDATVKKSLAQRNSVGGESKVNSIPLKRSSLQHSIKEKRVQSARVYKADDKKNELNTSQVSIDYNKMYYSNIFQENSINQESKDYKNSKDSHLAFNKPKQLDLNNSVSMPAEDEIFSSRSNFMRGNTLKNNWMNRLQQQIIDRRQKESQKQQKQKKQKNSNYLIIEVQQPATPQQQAPFCLTNEFIKKQSNGQPFQMINSFFIDSNHLRQNSTKIVQSNATENIAKIKKSLKPSDENRLSIASIIYLDNQGKNISNKSKQSTPISTPGHKKMENRTPLNFNNWKK